MREFSTISELSKVEWNLLAEIEYECGDTQKVKKALFAQNPIDTIRHALELNSSNLLTYDIEPCFNIIFNS